MGALAVVVLVLQPLIFYRRHLFFLTSHIPFDIAEYHLPLIAFIERSVKQHVWPWWNPLVYCGFPIHADITAGLFYPFTWAAILADQFTGGGRLFYWLEWLIPMHMIIAGIGAYLLLRQLRCSALVALFGATVYQIGPFFVSQAEHLGAICTAAWFPIIVLCICRLADGFRSRWASLLAIAVAMTVLAGFPAAMIVVVVSSGLICVALISARIASWRVLAFFVLGCTAGAAVAAVQLIPTMQLSGLSVASLRYKWLGDGGGMHWESLVSFIWPNYYQIFSAWDRTRYKLPYEFTFMFTFCGYAAAILIPAAAFFLRRVKLLPQFLSLFLLSTVWMLGEMTPVYPAVYRKLPHFLQNALYPEFALLGFSLFAACTAALVLAAVEFRIPQWLLVSLVVLNSWNMIRTGANKDFNSFDGGYKVVSAPAADGAVSLPDGLRKLTHVTDPPSRIEFFSDVGGLTQTTPIFDIASAAGDSPFLLLRYYDLRHSFSNDVEWSRRQFPRGFNSPWIRALNVSYVLDKNDLYRVENPLPRFYIQNHVISVENAQQAVDEAAKPGFAAANMAIVENMPKDLMPDSAASGEVKLLSYGNNEVDLQVRTSGRTLLVTSESLYPGWTATVNGEPAPILRTNVAFRGIPLNAGENHVVMNYFPDKFVLALFVTIFGLGVVLCGLLVR